MKKLLLFALLAVILVGSVSAAFIISYSNPKDSNGNYITEWKIPGEKPLKVNCPRDEWNDNFKLYREGKISKEDMIKYIRTCN